MDQPGVPEAWVKIPGREEFLAGVRRAGIDHPYDFGAFFPAMGRLIMAHPRIGAAFAALYGQIMFSKEGVLAQGEREMVASVAAAAQDCHYWTQSHAEFLRVEHPDHELVEAIKERRWRELTHLSDRQRSLCAVAEKMSAEPTKMTEDDWRPLRDLGFDDGALLEVGHIVAVFNYLTRMADGFGLLLDEETQEAARTGEPLRRSG